MIYVDELIDHGRPFARAGWPFRWSCHLLADGVQELHAFAEQLGLRRKWFQVSRGGVPHYDLTRTMRAAAVRLGAVELADHRAVAGVMARLEEDFRAHLGASSKMRPPR